MEMDTDGMTIVYPNHVLNNNIYNYIQRLSPRQTSTQPIVLYKTQSPPAHGFEFYTLVMHDPDAVGGNRIHWLVINNDDTVLPYKGPRPPPGSGIHRYIFLLIGHRVPIRAPRGLKRKITMTQLWETLCISPSSPSSHPILSSRWFWSGNELT